MPATEAGTSSTETPVSEVVSPGRSAEEPLAGEVAVDPATGRPAGRAQALVLLLASCLAVLGAVLLAPVLPDIEDAFAGTAGVEALTPIVLTAPALVIGLTAPFAGRVVDRLGRKRLLVARWSSTRSSAPRRCGCPRCSSSWSAGSWSASPRP